MTPESEIQQRIQIEAVNHGCQLMRNNAGAYADITGRVVRYGLGNTSKKQNDKIKSSDLIGITSIVITPDMVGKTIGVFTAIEVKREGWSPSQNDKREHAQLNFINWIRSRGGISGFCSSVEGFRKLIKDFGK